MKEIGINVAGFLVLCWIVAIQLFGAKVVLTVWETWQSGPDEWSIRLIFAFVLIVYAGWNLWLLEGAFRDGRKSKA